MENQEQQYSNNHVVAILGGMLMGGLVGTAVMLLLAPQSGKETRVQIKHKGIELRDQATETVEEALAQVRQTAQQITGGVREKIEELQQRAQDIFDEQREQLSTLFASNNSEINISS